MRGRIAARLRNDVRDETLLAFRRRMQRDRRLRHAAMLAQHVLDLAELHAIAAHLHLIVGAAEELDRAVRQAAHAIARAIDALAAERRRTARP